MRFEGQGSVKAGGGWKAGGGAEGRSLVGMRVAVGLSLAGCEEPAVAARALGLEEDGPAAGEGEGATE